jgi:hypothetical protein
MTSPTWRSTTFRSTIQPTPLATLAAVLGLMLAPGPALAADKPNGAQKRAVEQYLDAVASGSPQAVAYAIHPADLEALRTRILTQLREEAGRGDGTIRARLFGPGRPLAEIERLTSIDFYATLGRKLYLFGREYKDANWVAPQFRTRTVSCRWWSRARATRTTRRWKW